ncbi:putative DNA repair and recombination protein [Cercophora samala]|uniref:ATP-dependent DNA helicase n=1 Tax=Cercophora samala TaxID=330535 RepID=A0AA39YZY2_9PEZI|nr:putative DNA repair and recombination protein [Cercophora samala]
MTRRLKSSLSVASKGLPVGRCPSRGDHYSDRGRRNVPFFVPDESKAPLIPSGNLIRNRHTLYRPTAFAVLQPRRQAVALSLLNSVGFSHRIFDDKYASEQNTIRRRFSTDSKRRYDRSGLGDETGPTLLPEQQNVVDHAVAGHNIFFTGSAGCGKSTVLHEVRRRLEAMDKQVCVMAPTGIVALAIGGTTTWSFAGWTPNSTRIPLEGLPKYTEKTLKRLLQTDVIIIDEISMIENNFFERLDFLLRNIQSRSFGWRAKPFGGIQVIVTGDFCQLPPVKPFQHCFSCGRELRKPKEGIDSPVDDPLSTRVCVPCDLTFKDEDKFAFSSAAWNRCNFVNIHLKAIHRQKDPAFISLLQKCRLGVPFSRDDITALTRPKPGLSPGEAVKLFPVRADVWQTNHEAFEQLKTPSVTFECEDHFQGRRKHYPEYGRRLEDGTLAWLDQHRFERELRLKKDMRVLLLRNLNLKKRLCNGSQGKIVGFEPFAWSKIPTRGNGAISGRGDLELKEKLIRNFVCANESQLRKEGFGWPVVEFDNGVVKTVYPDCDIYDVGYQRPYSMVSRTQVPLTAGYALTIHKAQGMTLEKVIVDVSKVFEEKQIYVALSRAKSLDGLQVVGLTRGSVGYDDGEGSEKVRRFLRETFGDEVVTY